MAKFFAIISNLIAQITAAWSAQKKALDVTNQKLRVESAKRLEDLRAADEANEALHEINQQLVDDIRRIRAERDEFERKCRQYETQIRAVEERAADEKRRIDVVPDADAVLLSVR